MAKETGAPQFSVFQLLVSDFLNWLLAVAPVSLIGYVVYFILSRWIWPLSQLLSFFLIMPLIILAYPMVIVTFRLMLPRLKPGVYEVGLNAMFITWGAHLVLARTLRVAGLNDLLFSFGFSRYLILRALGAKVPLNLMCSLGVGFTDCPLIEIEDGVNLTEGVQISCHTVVRGKLWLRKVKVGRNSYVGMNVLIGPGTSIGADCQIGPYNRFMGDRIADGTTLEAFAWERGNPEHKHNRT